MRRRRSTSTEWRVLSHFEHEVAGAELFRRLTLLGATEARLATRPVGDPEDELVVFSYWIRWPREKDAPEDVYAQVTGEPAPFSTQPVSSSEGLGADAWEPFGTPPEPPHQSR